MFYRVLKSFMSNITALHTAKTRPAETEKVTVNLGFVDLGHIDLLVTEGFYSNRTDFIRTAIRNQLVTQQEVVRQVISRKSLVLGLQRFTRANLESLQRAGEMLEFLGDSMLVAHNANFDFGFLNSELENCGLEPVSKTRMIDTVALARVRHPGAKLSLDALCTRYGIDRSHRTRHGALLDAELLAQVYVELTGGRQIGLELAADGGDTLIGAVAMPQRERPFRPARPHGPSEAEQAAHAAFLETIKAPLWKT